MSTLDTIVAIATPSGRGGVGIVRISGEQALSIAKEVCDLTLKPRYAHYLDFLEKDQKVIDTGIAIYFPGPNSFTGEDVIELQGHGGPIVMQLLLNRVISLGARVAHPGEFSERAFLNDKIDLAQAEAIADLIDSQSEEAAKSATRSLRGEFSKDVNKLLKSLVELRVYVESAIDFPEEEIDFLGDGVIQGKIDALQSDLADITHKAGAGRLLRNGFNVALAGRPNAGKSSLLNVLSREDVAIVTDVEGTTRDSITVTVNIDGMPVHLTDTAGLRDSEDKVEKIGIARARKIIADSDHVLLLIDATKVSELNAILKEENLDNLGSEKLSVIYNKSDLTTETPTNGIAISAKNEQGIEELKKHVKEKAGYQSSEQSAYSARGRHIQALKNTKEAIMRGEEQLKSYMAGELLAEELLQAQQCLNSITGEFSSDDLLSEIFSSFCIGK